MRFLRALKSRFWVLAILSSVTPAIAAAAAPPRYFARPIGALPGGWTYGRSLNNLGQATGDSGAYDPLTPWRSFVSQPDGTVQPVDLPSYVSSGGWVINDAGQVTGIGYASGTVYGAHDRRLFVYTPGVGALDLGWGPGDRSGYIIDMNESGDVTGYWYISSTSTTTFLYRAGSGLVTLSSVGDNFPRDINNLGQAVGSFGPYNAHHAFRWDGTTFTDLGTLGGPNSSAYYITDSGAVVGEAQVQPPEWQGHAYVWTPDGQMTDIQPAGATWSSAIWITNDGFVVGQYTNGSGQYRGFYQHPGEPAEDMGVTFSLGWEGVTRVNASHEMIGITVDEVYVTHPFYYSPDAGFHLLEDLVVNPAGINFYEAMDINDAGMVLLNTSDSPTSGAGAYLLIQIRRGDLNCDHLVNFDDINPFVQALTDPAGWQAAYPACVLQNGDVNEDGAANFDDINPFVELLSAGG